MAFIATSHVFEVQTKFVYNLSSLLFFPENIDSHMSVHEWCDNPSITTRNVGYFCIPLTI